MTETFFWLRVAQGLCTAACAMRGKEWALHSVRAQSEVLLYRTADEAKLYSDRANEQWTALTLDADRLTAKRWGFDELVREAAAPQARPEDAVIFGKELCALAHARFCVLLDICVRGLEDVGMSPTLLDLCAALTAFDGDREPDLTTCAELAIGAGESLRGMVDASQPDWIRKCNNFCIRCDRVRDKSASPVEEFGAGFVLFSEMTRACVDGEIVGIPPILPDVFSRLMHRFGRVAAH